MKGIGGNLTGIIQTCTATKNAIGEGVNAWTDAQTLRGWLDLSGGSSGYTAFSAKVQESTHVFLSDYAPLAEGIRAETSRMVIGGKHYDVMLIDDPMEMHQQLEIYLKYTGGD
mgnify:FL=1